MTDTASYRGVGIGIRRALHATKIAIVFYYFTLTVAKYEFQHILLYYLVETLYLSYLNNSVAHCHCGLHKFMHILLFSSAS